MAKNKKNNKQKPPVEEEQGKNNKLPLIIYNAFMAIIGLVSLAITLHSCYNEQALKPKPIKLVNEELQTGAKEILNAFNSLDYVGLFSKDNDANNYKVFHKNVNSMVLLWERYGDLDVHESGSVIDNIVILKDKVNTRKKFDKALANVVSSIKSLYETELIKECDIFPNKDRVLQTIEMQNIWITTDSINNNYALASLDKLRLDKECTKEMIFNSIRDLQESDNDPVSKSGILNIFKLLLEIGNSFEQYKISHIE